MRRFVPVPFIPVLTAALVIAPALAQSRYTNPNGFSFVAPAGWTRNDARVAPPRAAFMGPKDGAYTANCLVSTADAGKMTVETLVKGFEDNDIKSKEAKLISKRTGKAGTGPNSAPATLLKVSRTIVNPAGAKFPIVQWQFITVHSGKVALLTFSVSESAAGKYEKIVDSAVTSFRWDK